MWAAIKHRVTNTPSHQQLGAKVLNAKIRTHPMTTVTGNADGVVTKIAQTTPQIGGATPTDQHQIHPIQA